MAIIRSCWIMHSQCWRKTSRGNISRPFANSCYSITNDPVQCSSTVLRQNKCSKHSEDLNVFKFSWVCRKIVRFQGNMRCTSLFEPFLSTQQLTLLTQSTPNQFSSWKWLLPLCEQLQTTSVSPLFSLADGVFALEPAELGPAGLLWRGDPQRERTFKPLSSP